MNTIQEFLRNIEYKQLPVDVVNQAKRCLYDLIGTAAAGADTDPARLITKHAEQHFASAPAGPSAPPILGGTRLSPVGAALVGGMMIDSIDCHDGHKLTKGHVGCAMLPGLVAACEATGKNLTGEQFLALFTAGYEIGTRAGIALHASVPDYHTSGAWNAVNCAALAAHLLNLEPEQFNHAIGIGEYHGPRSQMMRGVDHPTMLKDGSGWGAMAGVSAAWLAKDGFTGAPAVTVVADEVIDIWRDLGENWLILDQYFKPYPICRWAQPAIAAALSLRNQHDFDAQSIKSILITTFHQAARLQQGLPSNSEQAQYAISFPLAAALVRGKLGPKEISDDALKDPDILEICERIKVDEDTAYNALFPGERWAKVKISLLDGQTLESEPHQALGDPHIPLSDKYLKTKFSQLTEPLWGSAKSEQILKAILELENSDLFSLLDLIRSP